MPSSHLILCQPLPLLPPIAPSIRVFSNESTLRMRWPKYWSFSFSIIPSKEIPGLMSFRKDWLDLLAVQGTLKSLLRHQSSKASILRRSAFFTVQLSHPYMTTGKTIALTRWTFVGKINSISIPSKCDSKLLEKFVFLKVSRLLYWRRQWHPAPVLLPGKSHGWRSLVDCSPWGPKSRIWLSDFTFTLHFHALEKEMATHSSVLGWRIPGLGEPSGLPSMGSHRVRHDWSDLAATAAAAACCI